MTARRRTTRRTVGQPPSRREDHLAVEEPLQILLGGHPFVVTMRTPGDDIDLALGLLVGEGIISHRDHAPRAIFCSSADGPHTYNVLNIGLAPDIAGPDTRHRRGAAMTSACGVCGKTSIDAVRQQSTFPPTATQLEIPEATLTTLPTTLRHHQTTFDRTGGVHAAALFDTAGTLLAAREDVGRHNAVDKVVGWALRQERLPLSDCVLMLSGRAGFELVQKAAMAGIPLVAAVSAPSSLAVDLADEVGITLVGFVRDDSMVVYSRPERIVAAAPTTRTSIYDEVRGHATTGGERP